MHMMRQDLAARNVIVDENLVCKISAIDQCEDFNKPEPFVRVRLLIRIFCVILSNLLRSLLTVSAR